MVVCCREGQIYEIGTPSVRGLDTSESFEIKNISYKETRLHLPSEDAPTEEKSDPKLILKVNNSSDLLGALQSVESNKRSSNLEDDAASPRDSSEDESPGSPKDSSEDTQHVEAAQQVQWICQQV
jgi:hypothetical protein